MSAIEANALAGEAAARPARTSEAVTLPDGRVLSYAEYGDPDGLPVFALHGTPGSRLNFTPIDELAQARRLRVIAPDRPGCGGSDFTRLDSFSGWAADLEALADALSLRIFALIGVSGGGPYAVAAAFHMPERVQVMALVSPIGPVAEPGQVLRLSPLHKRIFVEMAKRPFLAASAFWAMRTLLLLMPGLAYRGLMRRASSSDQEILARPHVRQALLEGHREGLRRGIKGAKQDLRLFGLPWRIPFNDVIAPAVLWQGLEDRNVPAAASEYLADELANCRLDVIPQAGHYWVFDHLDAVLDAVEAAMKAGEGLF